MSKCIMLNDKKWDIVDKDIFKKYFGLKYISKIKGE